eukprot:COSAG06_NODE_3195_length_5703_cov_94.949143_5_plen_121_part_00
MYACFFVRAACVAGANAECWANGCGPTVPVGKNAVVLSHLYIETIILPRQARDKHRESTQKGDRFPQGTPPAGCAPCTLDCYPTESVANNFIALRCVQLCGNSTHVYVSIHIYRYRCMCI